MYKQWVCIWHISQYLQSCHDSYSAMFPLCPPRLVSFPLPSQLPPLCYQATALVYKYLVSHWPHPVSEMRCSSFSTYTVPCFHLHDSLCCLSVYWSYSFVFCCILYLIYTLGEQILSLEVSPYLLPLFFGLKFVCLIIIAEISPGNWVEDDLK